MTFVVEYHYQCEIQHRSPTKHAVAKNQWHRPQSLTTMQELAGETRAAGQLPNLRVETCWPDDHRHTITCRLWMDDRQRQSAACWLDWWWHHPERGCWRTGWQHLYQRWLRGCWRRWRCRQHSWLCVWWWWWWRQLLTAALNLSIFICKCVSNYCFIVLKCFMSHFCFIFTYWTAGGAKTVVRTELLTAALNLSIFICKCVSNYFVIVLSCCMSQFWFIFSYWTAGGAKTVVRTVYGNSECFELLSYMLVCTKAQHLVHCYLWLSCKPYCENSELPYHGSCSTLMIWLWYLKLRMIWSKG